MRISDWSSDVCSSDLLRRRQQLILAEGGHQRLARGVMTGIADAVGDRLLDGSQIAAPQPVVVIEVGIALRPCGPRPMALDAMHPERGAPALDRLLHQFGPPRDRKRVV